MTNKFLSHTMPVQKNQKSLSIKKRKGLSIRDEMSHQMGTEDRLVTRDTQGVRSIIKGNGKKHGKHYKSLLDICPSGTKADEKEVGKNTGTSEKRNKNTVIMAKK